MSESADQTFDLLEKNNLVLPVYLRTILTSLNYSGLHVLSKLTEDDFKELEESVQTILSEKDLLEGKTPEELKQMFGPMFFNRPEKFKLLPGDKKILRSMSELCQKILIASPLVLEVKKPAASKKQQSIFLNNAHIKSVSVHIYL